MPLPPFAAAEVRVKARTATTSNAHVMCRNRDIFEGFGLGGSDEGTERVYAAFSGSSLLALACSIVAKILGEAELSRVDDMVDVCKELVTAERQGTNEGDGLTDSPRGRITSDDGQSSCSQRVKGRQWTAD